MWKKIKSKAFMGQESKYYILTTITKQKFKTLSINQQTVISKQTFYSICQQNSWAKLIFSNWQSYKSPQYLQMHAFHSTN